MKNYLYCLVAVISIYSFPTSTVSAKQPVASLIGNIQNSGEGFLAGCYLYRKGNKEPIFYLSATDKSRPLMNINGKDRVLKFVSQTPAVERQVGKKGERSTVIYKSGKIIVRIDRVATKVCDGSQPDCTGTSYDAKINLSVGNQKQVISATGYCGC